jgi:hypothetical protein
MPGLTFAFCCACAAAWFDPRVLLPSSPLNGFDFGFDFDLSFVFVF